MVENLDRLFSGVDDLKAVLEAVPEAGFHLDIGHANLRLGLREGGVVVIRDFVIGRRFRRRHGD